MTNKHSLFLSGLIVLALTFVPTAKAQKVTVDNYQNLQVEFATGQLKASEATLNGQIFSLLSIDDHLPSSEVGQPCLPTYSTLVETPLCKGYEVTVSDAEYDTLDAATLGLRHPLMPLQPSRSKSDTLQHPTIVGSAYTTNAFYQVALASVESVGIARDRNLARLQFSPVSYNPVSGQVVVCRRATVNVHYVGADREATLSLFDRYHTPAFGTGISVLNNLYPKAVSTTAPIRYLIVSHSMFRGQLDSFVQWKRRKGFLVDIAYTDSAAVGTTSTSIQSFIKSQYTNATPAKPAPTFLLLVGDHEQIPAFTGTTDDDHITDLYYTTWTTGDNIPDCYHGRFSAQSISQLTPQIQKTLMYEQYTFADPSFLDRAVMVAGVDGGSSGDYGYTHADPAMDYAILHYINGAQGFSQVRYFKNNTSVVPTGSNITVAGNSSSMSATVRNYYNQGAGWINYSAHGSATSWGTPNFTTSHAAAMTNSQKFGLMIGNCCLTNKFETSTCLGESVLRVGNYCGAVGYIGGSNSTYWNEDFYWAVGLRNGISATMSLNYNANNLGVYDRLCHTHGEAYNKWVLTQGDLMFQGNMAVQSSTSSRKLYYWEIYHLMGDPSLMPYLTQADSMTVSVAATVTVGTSSLPVTTVPHAYVALVDATNNQLVASAFADENGIAVLSLPSSLMAGNYRIAASAQQYRTTFVDIMVIQPDGPYAIVSSVNAAPLNAGETVALTLHFENIGNFTAHNIVAQMSSNNPYLTLSVAAVVLDSLAAGASFDLTGAVSASVAADAPDNSTASLSFTTSWTGNTITSNTLINMQLYAPVPSISFSNPEMSILAGNTATLTATLRNSGHAPVQSPLTFTSPTALLTVTPAATTPFSLAPGSDTAFTLTLHADSQLPQHITIPLLYQYATLSHELPVYVGQSYSETFEGGSMNLAGMTNNSNHPWIIIDTLAYEGTHSMRSAANLSNYDSSVMRITVNVTVPDSISFYYKVSSEQSYDKLFFLIDGVEKFNASGETDWTRAGYPLTVGSHTLTFRYKKDVSVSRGSDCAWIDNIKLPHQEQTVAFRNDTLCEGSAYAPFGETINTDTPGNGTAQGTINGQLTLIDYLVLSPAVSTDSIVACDSYLWNGQEYTADGSYTQAYVNNYGCYDSITLILTLHHSVAVTVADTTRAAQYVWNGHVYTASGEYQQVLTTVDGCDSTVTLQLTLLSSEGIDDLQTSGSELRIYPNPTTGLMQLSQPADEVRIYDMTGRQIALLHNVRQIDLGTLPAGVYTLRLATPRGNAILRAVRQ